MAVADLMVVVEEGVVVAEDIMAVAAVVVVAVDTTPAPATVGTICGVKNGCRLKKSAIVPTIHCPLPFKVVVTENWMPFTGGSSIKRLTC